MTRAERKAVAETLREWAAWCEANPDFPYWMHFKTPVEIWFDADCWCSDGFPKRDIVTFGAEAATGLCLAAAMVEAGDSA